VKRYILEDNEFLRRIEKLYSLGRRVIIIQSGEVNNDEYFRRRWKILKIIRKSHVDLTLIACFGCLSKSKYKKLKSIGIERYLLKFETSSPAILRIMCPSMLIPATSSLELLKTSGQYLGLLAGANVVTLSLFYLSY